MKKFNLILIVITMQVSAYNLNSGDVLHMEVYGEPELALDVTVDSLGYIQYPFVGKLKVLGNKIETVKNDVVARLKDGYFINPQVSVYVKKYKPFFIQGEVNNPGSYAFEIGMTVRKAIALAGGMTERASKKKIYLTKAEDQSKKEIKVSMNYELSSGDIIQIKESLF